MICISDKSGKTPAKMFAEIDRMDVTMLVILAMFAPAFLCAQLLEFIYKKLC
jgi:hypothetical protein